LGSLNKIWPWKEIIDKYTLGKKEIIVDKNVLPNAFEGDPQLILAIGLAITGFSLIFILERMASKK
jgi:putative membrane protein